MSFVNQHLSEVAEIASKIDPNIVERMVDSICSTRDLGGKLFILGLGGSAANASHAVNDFRKLAGIESYAPTDNVAEITARTNDEGFETIFVEYLRTSRLSEKDCLLIFSVGGGDLEKSVSRNLCNAVDFAKERRCKVLGIVGRQDGYVGIHADISLVIPLINLASITPHSESFQSVIWHLMVSHPKLKLNATKW